MTTQAGKTHVVIGILAAALLALTALAVPATARADAAAGAALYKEKCIGCHAADGSGDAPMGKALKAGDLRSPQIQGKKDAELAASITNGKGKMPAQKGLSAAQVSQLLDYVRTLAKAK